MKVDVYWDEDFNEDNVLPFKTPWKVEIDAQFVKIFFPNGDVSCYNRGIYHKIIISEVSKDD